MSDLSENKRTRRLQSEKEIQTLKLKALNSVLPGDIPLLSLHHHKTYIDLFRWLRD